MTENDELTPTMSIIVPVRNGELTIEPLLQSLLNLDIENQTVEVIVVDGRSTDRTKEIVSKYPVKLLDEEGTGLNAARNTGIKHSGGEIIAFTDCDCVVPQDWAKKIVENFQDPQVSCVGGSAKGYNRDFISQYADTSIVPLMPFFQEREELGMIQLFLHHPAGCNMAFRREAFEKAGGFDERIRYGFDDVELIERVCNAGYKMVLDPNVFVWHKHRSTLTEFLHENFQYGRGSGLLLRRKGLSSMASKWALLSLLGFQIWLLIVGFLSFLSLTTSALLFLLLLFGFTGLPLLLLMGFYASREPTKRDFRRILIYPFIDFLRSLAFCCGEIYQLFQK